jgi:LmbE family N-acetylglucosaminyl deacetylase
MKNILAIGAHPDDIEIGCGGTLAKLKEEGHSLSLLIVSDGSAGGKSDIRRKEQKASAKILGVDHIYWGGIKDTEIVISKSIIKEFENIIQQVSPDYIFINYPDDTHQDHRHLAQIAISATRYVQNVLFYETPTSNNFQPDIYMDLGEKYLQIKHQLLYAHKSQVDKTNIANLSIIDVATSNAQFRGTQGRVKYAEAFKPLRLFLDV